jgi:PelA/Pel-15E family pectate lyase
MSLPSHRILLVLLVCWSAGRSAHAASPMDISKLEGKSDAWFTSDEGRRILDNVVSWQNANGGWWKAYDTSKPRTADAKAGDPSKPSTGDEDSWHRASTFDNKATYTEMRLLARGYRLTQEPKYRASFERGLKYIFESQYPNGGWPQRFPLGNDYGRHITYNDNAMTGVMALLMDVAKGEADFAWVAPDQRKHAKEAFDRGVQCVLDTQIKVNGKLTGWCQQHDEKTLAPTSARTYELPSIAAAETAGILRLLMKIDDPSPQVRQSIRAAAAWLEQSKMTGKRLVERKDPSLPKGRDVELVDDPSAAEPIWSRFYEIDTNRPFFCGRDGVKKYSLSEIEHERRVGYAWVRPFGTDALKEYQKWASKHAEDKTAGAGK